MSAKPEAMGTLTQLIQENFSDAFEDFHNHRGDETVKVDSAQIVPICQFLRDDERCKMELMIDLTAVDYIKEQPRFEMVYHFKSLSLEHRLRVKTRIPEETPEIDSIHELWLAANWYERECYDMYGIQFKNHPNLERILMYPEFEGYPLRKDYPVDGQQPRVEMRAVNERHDYTRS